MSNPKDKITPEGIAQMKEDIKKILYTICQQDKLRIINFQRGQIYKAE
jgi:hypothetical protein